MSQVTIEKLERLIEEYKQLGLPEEEISPLKQTLSDLKRGGVFFVRKPNRDITHQVDRPGSKTVYVSTVNRGISSQDLNGVNSKKVKEILPNKKKDSVLTS